MQTAAAETGFSNEYPGAFVDLGMIACGAKADARLPASAGMKRRPTDVPAAVTPHDPGTGPLITRHPVPARADGHPAPIVVAGS